MSHLQLLVSLEKRAHAIKQEDCWLLKAKVLVVCGRKRGHTVGGSAGTTPDATPFPSNKSPLRDTENSD